MRGRNARVASLLIGLAPLAAAADPPAGVRSPLFTSFFWRVARADVVVRGRLHVPDEGLPSLRVLAVYKGRLDPRAFLFPSWMPPYPLEHDACEVRSGTDVCLLLQRTTIGDQPRYHVETRTGNQGFIPLDGGVNTWRAGLYDLSRSGERELPRHAFLERLVAACEEGASFDGLLQRYRRIPLEEDESVERLALQCIGRLRTPRALEFLSQTLDVQELDGDPFAHDRQIATARALVAFGTPEALDVLDGYWSGVQRAGPEARDSLRLELLAAFLNEVDLDLEAAIARLDAWTAAEPAEEERTAIVRTRATLVERQQRTRAAQSAELAFADGVLRVRR